ncbi:hypothetical protein GOP47_0029419 [Adiantum capillus-veneris]|nr:hypothetical protein GOP47_0029419 [Adiantum capillus-veneris]
MTCFSHSLRSCVGLATPDSGCILRAYTHPSQAASFEIIKSISRRTTTQKCQSPMSTFQSCNWEMFSSKGESGYAY